MNTPFTANTQSEWNPNPKEEGIDSLAERDGQSMIGHAPDVAPLTLASQGAASTSVPPHVDDARNAVENALAAAPFDPSLSPVQSLNAEPVADNLHPPPNEAMTPPAPPQVPPPLMPAQGVVIPPPFNPAATNAAVNNNDLNTL
jgi:hypothetical protein